jgi:SAM-dependent methyltransferase
VLQQIMQLPGLRQAVQRTTEWIDLQWWFIDVLLRKVAPQANGRLLDVGCGDKPYEHLFRPYVSEYIGIEHEATFSQTSASLHSRKPDMLYDGKRLPFEDRTFDTVLNVQVLEHTPKPAALLAEMARVLKEDGLLILSAPFQFRLHEQPHDYFRYSPHGLRAMCDEVGLDVLEVHSQGSLWSVIAHKLNTFLAFRVARVGGLVQTTMGKLPHEAPKQQAARVWTLPWVAPSMLALAASARVLDAVAHEPEESMGYLILARRRRQPPKAT